MLKLCNPFLAVYASTVKLVTSNPGFGVNYFFLADIKHWLYWFPSRYVAVLSIAKAAILCS